MQNTQTKTAQTAAAVQHVQPIHLNFSGTPNLTTIFILRILEKSETGVLGNPSYLIQDAENTMVAVLFFVSLQKNISKWEYYNSTSTSPPLQKKRKHDQTGVAPNRSPLQFNSSPPSKHQLTKLLRVCVPCCSLTQSWTERPQDVFKPLVACNPPPKKTETFFEVFESSSVFDWSLRKSWSAGIQGEIWPTPPKKENMHQCSSIFFGQSIVIVSILWSLHENPCKLPKMLAYNWLT